MVTVIFYTSVQSCCLRLVCDDAAELKAAGAASISHPRYKVGADELIRLTFEDLCFAPEHVRQIDGAARAPSPMRMVVAIGDAIDSSNITTDNRFRRIKYLHDTRRTLGPCPVFGVQLNAEFSTISERLLAFIQYRKTRTA
jgi:hypothetical protein